MSYSYKVPIVKLGSISKKIDYGLTTSAKDSDGKPKFLRITDIQDNSVDWDNVPSCECTEKDYEKYALHKGDIVFARTGATTGKSFLIRECPQAVFASYLIRVSPSSKINSEYLSWFFQTPDYWRQITFSSTGTAQPGVNSTKLKELQIPLPPIEEQKRIAAILDKADRVRRKRQEAIRLTEELGRSIFLDMFGDPISQDWKMVKVVDMAEKSKNSMRTGPFGSNLLHSEFVDEGIPVLGIDNAVKNRFLWAKPRFITPEKYKQLKNYTVYPEDVVITIMGTCGRCAIIPDDCPTAINTKHLCCITTNKEICLPEFLYGYFLFHPIAKQYFERNTKGAIMDGLNQTIIKGLPIPLAPIDLQHQYKGAIQKLNILEVKANNHFGNSENLFNSLLQRAFRGEL